MKVGLSVDTLRKLCLRSGLVNPKSRHVLSKLNRIYGDILLSIIVDIYKVARKFDPLSLYIVLSRKRNLDVSLPGVYNLCRDFDKKRIDFKSYREFQQAKNAFYKNVQNCSLIKSKQFAAFVDALVEYYKMPFAIPRMSMHILQTVSEESFLSFLKTLDSNFTINDIQPAWSKFSNAQTPKRENMPNDFYNFKDSDDSDDTDDSDDSHNMFFAKSKLRMRSCNCPKNTGSRIPDAKCSCQTRARGESVSSQSESRGDGVSSQTDSLGESVSSQTESLGEGVSSQTEPSGDGVSSQTESHDNDFLDNTNYEIISSDINRLQSENGAMKVEQF